MLQRMAILTLALTISLQSISGHCQAGRTHNNGNYFVIRDDSADKLVKVKVLGEIQQPGIYMVPSSSNLSDVIAYAGGFSIKSNQTLSFSRAATGFVHTKEEFHKIGSEPIQDGDAIYAHASWKTEAPLYLQILTTLLSLATFAVVVSQN